LIPGPCINDFDNQFILQILNSRYGILVLHELSRIYETKLM
jgi:hypothetical protein